MIQNNKVLLEGIVCQCPSKVLIMGGYSILNEKNIGLFFKK